MGAFLRALVLQNDVSVSAAVVVEVDRVRHERLREVRQCAALLVDRGLVLAHLRILLVLGFALFVGA